MSVAADFSSQLDAAMEALTQDEWAMWRLRDRLVKGVDSEAAFASITEVLALAGLQKDSYCFVECCWLTSDLARRSNTTERPPGLLAVVQEAFSASAAFGAENEVRKIADWYRIPIAHSE